MFVVILIQRQKQKQNSQHVPRIRQNCADNIVVWITNKNCRPHWALVVWVLVRLFECSPKECAESYVEYCDYG